MKKQTKIIKDIESLQKDIALISILPNSTYKYLQNKIKKIKNELVLLHNDRLMVSEQKY